MTAGSTKGLAMMHYVHTSYAEQRASGSPFQTDLNHSHARLSKFDRAVPYVLRLLLRHSLNRPLLCLINGTTEIEFPHRHHSIISRVEYRNAINLRFSALFPDQPPLVYRRSLFQPFLSDALNSLPAGSRLIAFRWMEIKKLRFAFRLLSSENVQHSTESVPRSLQSKCGKYKSFDCQRF